MPVPVHIKVVFRGVFTGTPETWSFGQHYSADVLAAPDAQASDCHTDVMAAKWDLYFHTSTMQFPSSAKLTDVRAYKIGTDGLMEGNPNIFDCSALDYRGASQVIYPPQVALVMTHVANNRGPARLGRCYLPTSAPVGSDYRISTALADQIMGGYVQFLKDISDEIDLQGGASSEMLNISAVGAGGARQTVDHVECGRALDTLRSRRRALLEERRVGTHIDW